MRNPDEPTNRLGRRRWRWVPQNPVYLCLIFSAVLATPIMSFVVLVDPYGEFYQGRSPNLSFDERSRKMALYERFRSTEIDGLILGSSRAMKLRPGLLADGAAHRFFNFAVSSASLEDMLAIYRWTRHAGLKTLYLVVDPELLTHTRYGKELGQFEKDPYLARAFHQLAVPGAMEQGLIFLETLKHTFDYRHLSGSLTALNLQLTGKRPPLVLKEDGYLEYAWWAPEHQSYTAPAETLVEKANAVRMSIGNIQHVPADREASLVSLIQEPARGGVKVVLVLAPFNPRCYAQLVLDVRTAASLDAIRLDVGRLARALSITAVDLMDLRGAVAETGWGDCWHFDGETGAQIADLLKARSRQ